MEVSDCLLRVCQVFYEFLSVILMSLAFLFNQVLEFFSALWCLRVHDAFYLIDVWIIHISANNTAWALITLAKD